MISRVIERSFTRIGARAQVRTQRSNGVAIDVARDRDGEYFDIDLGRRVAPELSVVDAQPSLRHLLLMSRDSDGKHKFLCGHDERHWFVAAIPERASVSNVTTAFEALKPPAVQRELQHRGVKRKNRNRRRNEAFVRQGEWFFVPVGERRFPELFVMRNEPLRRGGGKPHVCSELVRIGGEPVYISPQHPSGMTESQRRNLLSRKPELRSLQWVVQRRNPNVFVRGRVRHPDHKTIVLNGWHQVFMNTETQSAAMRHVAFID